jgi:hypothetical protein
MTPFSLLCVAVLLASCHRGAQYNADEVRRLTMPSPLLTPQPGPTSWLTYVAVDYGKLAQPKLNSKEIRQIRAVLREVKVCQRPGVRYGFPPSNGRRNDPMVVFFQSQVVEQGRGYTPGHVFGNNNLIYLEDGTLAATMYEVSDREAIAEEPCFE